MHKLSAILLLCLLAGCAGRAGTTPASPTPRTINGPIRDRADEYRGLRTIVGHFSGGVWKAEVDKWMGRKHALMIELGDQLGTGAYSRSEVIDLLGPPDAIAAAGDPLYDQIRSQPEFVKPASGSYEFLVYHWRGEHDYLYLTVRQQTILGAGWWYAGE